MLDGLEATFGVPVIEAYGMTEAAHQMASNPLPPGTSASRAPSAGRRPRDRHPRRIRRPALAPGEIGEVAIRGANVFAGYEANPEANEAAFSDGWFRTGDEGSLDDDGYLTLRGRIKEIINRGGEKISPREVDEVLLAHPAVDAGRDVRDRRSAGSARRSRRRSCSRRAPDADERELQDFVAAQLAPFKVPRRIVVVDEIPKGPTGKVQRIGLAERLGVAATSGEPDRPPHGFLEPELVAIWESCSDDPGARRDRRLLRARRRLDPRRGGGRPRAGLVGDPDLPLVSIVRAPTLAAMAREVFAGVGAARSGIVPLQASGRSHAALLRPPAGRRRARLRRARAAARPGPAASTGCGLAASTTERRRSHRSPRWPTDYVAAVRDVQPHGPYVLGGFCLGAPVAVEMARRLEAAGERGRDAGPARSAVPAAGRLALPGMAGAS